ncbi:SoxR reducing system RseC family protein [Bacteroides sp. 224]|uniref:SoxR reducing system RseC family protein n=1 Tax=Bacteroides sp. 224 TaxID=2302936 RepID=UPI0013D3D36C|nr:SoxR reducing system RseC family protein [Bacteroides sp. 224]NDV65110.1 RseC/MucC family positive regulator of sigma(E) [Bacteroides sp. 224]
MANVITHQGIVESIEGSHLFVRIVQTSACASCSVKGHCSSSESKEKIIEISSSDFAYKIGDKVIVVGETSMGMMAVFLAFIIPFFILVVSLFVCMSVTDNNELLSGLISLGLLIPYYIVLWLNKNKLKKNFSFSIKPINC